MLRRVKFPVLSTRSEPVSTIRRRVGTNQQGVRTILERRRLAHRLALRLRILLTKYGLKRSSQAVRFRGKHEPLAHAEGLRHIAVKGESALTSGLQTG